ncbi:hypothetical protein LCGC14_1489320 [marine sediment metagenome]|uniref:Uncharacterized protein n=1 Tax=marine sediment metagenome TaxID=412755 RepID=A0A0F9LMM3_9ZZZZ
MVNETTLIRITEDTKDALDKRKEHHRETYDDVITRLLNGKK